jgi:UDP-glucose 4-epimerase
VTDLHRLCAQTVGVDAEPRYVAARVGDARRSVLDTTRAERELGWRAQMSLDEGLRATWQSIRST